MTILHKTIKTPRILMIQYTRMNTMMNMVINYYLKIKEEEDIVPPEEDWESDNDKEECEIIDEKDEQEID